MAMETKPNPLNDGSENFTNLCWILPLKQKHEGGYESDISFDFKSLFQIFVGYE